MTKKFLAPMVLAGALVAGSAAAAQPPGRIELRLSPILSLDSGLVGTNGVRVFLPEGNRSTQTAFGLDVGLGVLVTRMLEPGLSTHVLVVSTSGQNTISVIGFAPFLKFNTWVHPHVNPFVEPFAGVAIVHAGGTATNFNGGFFAGADFLISSWGIRLWTGLEALVGDSPRTFSIPIGWALVGYF